MPPEPSGACQKMPPPQTERQWIGRELQERVVRRPRTRAAIRPLVVVHGYEGRSGRSI